MIMVGSVARNFSSWQALVDRSHDSRETDGAEGGRGECDGVGSRDPRSIHVENSGDDIDKEVD